MYKQYIKRLLDIVISAIALLLVGWLLLFVALLLLFANKGAGVFFLQERPGKDGKIFRIVKFKTMTDERGPDGELLPDAQRLTNVGRSADLHPRAGAPARGPSRHHGLGAGAWP